VALSSYTLFEMRGAVKDAKANAPPDSIDRAINKAIQYVCRRRAWTDLLKFGTVSIPNQYNTGTVSNTPGTNVTTGVGTAWPTNDVVNTIGPTAIRQPGYQLYKPASMKKLTSGYIQPGDWLLIDTANGTQTEAVAVEWVSSDGLAFVAKFRNTHDANFTITKSSLANLQYRANAQPFTVQAVIDSTHLWLDQPWGGAPQAGVSYQILGIFFQVDPYAARLKFAWDYLQGIALDVDSYTFEQILIGDPQLTSSTNPTLAVPTPAGAGGVNQWMFYPPQNAQRQIGVVWVNTWPKLIQNDDRPPAFIDPECFIAGAKASVLRTKVIAKAERQDPYFDPALAAQYTDEFEGYIEVAEEHDEAQGHQRLQSYQYSASGGFSADYLRSHIGNWPSGGYGYGGPFG